MTQQHPMVEQVNRLVGNRLAAGGELSLPGVGSLRCERQAAQRLSKNRICPPCRVVSFSSQQQGVSLVDEIAEAIRSAAERRSVSLEGISPETLQTQARDIYDRWLSRVQEDDTLTIGGVGVLRFKHFTLDEAFDRRLNPQGHEPVTVRVPRRFDWPLWVGICAVLFVVGGTAFWWQGERTPALNSDLGPAVSQSVVADEASVPHAGEAAAEDSRAESGLRSDQDGPGMAAADDAESSAHAGVSTASDPAAASVSEKSPEKASAAAAQPAAASSDDGRFATFVSGRHYVVLGVFSTPENAARAVREAAGEDVAMTCGVYRFGQKFLVSPFESDDKGACTLFIQAHAERYPGMWTYTAR